MIILWRFSARSGPTLLFHEWSIHQNLTSDTTWWWLGKGQFVPRNRAWLPNHQKISKIQKCTLFILIHPKSSLLIFLHLPILYFSIFAEPPGQKKQMRQAAIKSYFWDSHDLKIQSISSRNWFPFCSFRALSQLPILRKPSSEQGRPGKVSILFEQASSLNRIKGVNFKVFRLFPSLIGSHFLLWKIGKLHLTQQGCNLTATSPTKHRYTTCSQPQGATKSATWSSLR